MTAAYPNGPTPRPTWVYPSPAGQPLTWGESSAVDWYDAWQAETAKFQAETITTSFLATLLRETDGWCTRCSDRRGAIVVVGQGLDREWICRECA